MRYFLNTPSRTTTNCFNKDKRHLVHSYIKHMREMSMPTFDVVEDEKGQKSNK